MKTTKPTNQTPLAFRDACTLMSLEKSEAVLDLLQAPAAVFVRPLEKTYLEAWMACAEEAWERAASILLAQEVAGTSHYLAQAQGVTIRRRRPWVLWLLGNLAAHLECLEANEHYIDAFRFLDERRMNIPWLRIQLHYDHAQWLAHTHDFYGARVQYEAALALCVGDSQGHETVPGIYRGLLVSMSHRKESLEQALTYGKCALASATHAQAQAEVLYQMASVFDRLGQHGEATAAYMDALQLAENRTTLISLWAALAQTSLKEHDILAAQGYCSLVQNQNQESLPADLQATLSLVQGKVAHFQATATGDLHQAQVHWEEAVAWYTKALETSPHHAEALSLLAQVLEEILERDSQRALTSHWRDAYRIVTHQI